jgi:hypothetical protein
MPPCFTAGPDWSFAFRRLLLLACHAVLTVQHIGVTGVTQAPVHAK